jgi:methionyl-tRNA formyltransferase
MKGSITGPVLLCERIPIAEDDTTGSLFPKLAQLGADTLIRTLRGVRDGSVVPVPQSGEAVLAPPLRKWMVGSNGRVPHLHWRIRSGECTRGRELSAFLETSGSR